MDIPQDKAREYMEVAGLVCLDIDILLKVSQDKSLTADELRAQIAHLHEAKEKVINNPEDRRSRYSASQFLFNLAAAGMIRSTPLDTGEKSD